MEVARWTVEIALLAAIGGILLLPVPAAMTPVASPGIDPLPDLAHAQDLGYVGPLRPAPFSVTFDVALPEGVLVEIEEAFLLSAARSVIATATPGFPVAARLFEGSDGATRAALALGPVSGARIGTVTIEVYR